MANRINIDGEIREYPDQDMSALKPFRHGLEWGDNGRIVVNWTRYREEWRKTAALDRADFVNAAADAGILTDDEAIIAALGQWPESLEGALSAMSLGEARTAKVVWASRSVINRNHPLIAAVTAFKKLTDEQVDALFGYDGEQ